MNNNNIPVAKVVTGRYDDNFIDVELGNNNLSDKIITTYSLSKTVKWLAIIDIFFSFLIGFYNYYFFIPLLCAAFGYYGAIKFNKNYINIYLIYNILNIILRTVYTVYMIVQLNGDNNSNYNFGIFFSILCILIEFWILRIIYKFNKALSELNINELAMIKDLSNKKIKCRVIYI